MAGSAHFQQMLTPEQKAQISYLMPMLSRAVAGAENNKRNQGVLSIPTSDPLKTQQDSIVNNYARWVNGLQPAPWIKDKPKKFVDFMQSRWAPLGVENDPNHLNNNWAGNVRNLMQQQVSPQEYENLKRLNIVMQADQNGQLV